MQLVTVTAEDYRKLAKKRLPRQLFDYLDGGAYGENTLRANSDDFSKIKLKQRVLKDVSNISTRVKIIGEECSMPVVLAPVGLAGMMAKRAEVQAARAAQANEIPFCLSTVSICPLEEVAAASERAFWFQLYMMRDREYVLALLERAKSAGCKTLVFTVDLAVVGARYRDVRNGMAGGVSAIGKLRAGWEFLSHPGWAFDVGINGKPHLFGNLSKLVPTARSLTDFKAWVDSQFDPSCTWEDIRWLRKKWNGNLIIKGVLCEEDAKAAVDAGADAIIISNHGGRQLDDVGSSISVTSRIANAVNGKATILMDGGIRSGLDVVKAIACGADAVLIGRPWIMALAARGEQGLGSYLQTLQSEMQVAMALTGATSLSELTAAIISGSFEQE